MATKIPHCKWIATSGESDWTAAASWNPNGVPNGDVEATFQNAGTFQCDITTAVDVQALEVKVAGATLMESAAGSITAVDLIMTAGTIALNGTNSFHDVEITGAKAVIGAANIWGACQRVFFTDAAVEFTDSQTYHYAFSGIGETMLGVTAGHTVDFAGDWALGNHAPAELQLGSATDTGTIKLAGKSFFLTPESDLTIDVAGGTVMSGSNVADVLARDMFEAASAVTIESGALLDLSAFGTAINLTGLTGEGMIKSPTYIELTLSDAHFGGAFSNTAQIIAEGSNTLYAAFNGAKVMMGAGADTLDISQATGQVTVSAPDGSSATVVAGPSTAVYFTDFSEGHVTAEVLGAADGTLSFVAGNHFTRVVVHDHGVRANLYLYDVTESQIHSADDGHGNLLITAAAADIAAHQSFVPMPHDAWG